MSYALTSLYTISNRRKVATEKATYGNAIHASIAAMVTEVKKQEEREEKKPVEERKPIEPKVVIEKAVKAFTKTFTEPPKFSHSPVQKEITPIIKEKAVQQIKQHFEKQVKVIVQKKIEKPKIKIEVRTEVQENFHTVIHGYPLTIYYTIDKVIEEDGRVKLVEMKTRPPFGYESQMRVQIQTAFYLWAYECKHRVIPEASLVVEIGTDKVLLEVKPDPIRNLLLREYLGIFVDHHASLKPLVATPNPHKCNNCQAKLYCPATADLDSTEIERRIENIEYQVKEKKRDRHNTKFKIQTNETIYADLVKQLRYGTLDEETEAYWDKIYLTMKSRVNSSKLDDKENTKELTNDLHNYLIERSHRKKLSEE